MKKLLNNYGFLFGIAGLIVLLDQVSKEILRRNLSFEEIWTPWDWLAPYARLINWQNFGAALGLFQNGNTVIAILAVIVSILIIIYFPRIPAKIGCCAWPWPFSLGGR